MNDSPDTQSEIRVMQIISFSAGFQHSHVIQVYDFWVHRSTNENKLQTYIQMERCDGTLEEYLRDLELRKQFIDPYGLFEIIIHVASGLRHCHDYDVLHRDLKPSNG
jgi:serine/threonine protein kinase